MNFIYTQDFETISELERLGFKIILKNGNIAVFDLAGKNIDTFDSIDKGKIFESNLMTFGR